MRLSSVDVDIAVTMARDEGHKDDVLDLLYRLRHTTGAVELLPSTEYAAFRYLLKFDHIDAIFKLLNDSVRFS